MPVEGLAIDAEHLARRFGRRWALVDVSLQLSRGEVMMVAGRNGSGKTTLLRVLATAIRADGGRAVVGGFGLAQRDEIRRVSALLAHQSYLYESLTARENLELVARFCSVRSGFSRTGPAEAGPHTVAAILDRVGLAARGGDPVSTFSAGMRKRLSFARVLLQEPSITFLDEPYGQLDPEGFGLVDEVVSELKHRGAAVVIATHQVERIGALADRRITLEAGRVV
jgi:ABC-type multidrug transport system ATPase subunit